MFNVTETAPKKKKARAGAASGQKLGRLESFKIKEREREYERMAKELEIKMSETINVKAKISLQKQKDCLDVEYADVLNARGPKSSAKKRKSTATKN